MSYKLNSNSIKKTRFLFKSYSIIYFILILTSTGISENLYSPTLKKIQLKTQIYKIPKYKDNQNIRLNDIAIDKKNGHLCFSTDNSWGDMPFKNGIINFQKGFMAPTKGFRLKALAKSNNNIAVLDIISRTIMNGKQGKYKIPNSIKDPTALAYHNNHYYIVDNFSNEIYKLKIKSKNSSKLIVIKKYKTLNNICGMDSDSRNLYICDNYKIYRLNKNFKIDIIYNFMNSPINGIIVHKKNTFFAVSKMKNEIFKLTE